jgi:hypothetical protein
MSPDRPGEHDDDLPAATAGARRGGAMDHTAPKPQTADARDGALTRGQVANPRRTRLGADGRPIPRPAETSGT